MTKDFPRPVWSALLLLLGLAGGLLLARWLNSGQAAPTAVGRMPQPASAAKTPLTMPSARLGATEGQMNQAMATPDGDAADPGARRADSVRAGEVSSAGAAYDLDPNAISSG